MDAVAAQCDRQCLRRRDDNDVSAVGWIYARQREFSERRSYWRWQAEHSDTSSLDRRASEQAAASVTRIRRPVTE